MTHIASNSAALLLEQTAQPLAFFNTTFKYELLVVALLIAFFALVRATLSVEAPGALQQVAEMLHEFVGGQAEQVIGHGYERYQAFITCIFLFVLCNNVLGLIPHVETPTSVAIVPLGIATLAFLYYNYHGIRVQGPITYLKHFAGPVWWISWLLFPVEIISHLARVMSLTIRLYANMLASDLLTLICFSIFPFVAPTAFLALHFLVSLIQAYVFMLLTTIYIGMAVAQEH
ncbi:MAG TPA: F0F1 ATP synthase subunit A [Terracidiphilus sp.]|nr:F0F1 ATP synthase subunit A [Terracidiphilus sp.]